MRSRCMVRFAINKTRLPMQADGGGSGILPATKDTVK
jgi:hypothetical protein